MQTEVIGNDQKNRSLSRHRDLRRDLRLVSAHRGCTKPEALSEHGEAEGMMPDNNKLKLFKNIGMCIVSTCLTCKYGVIQQDDDWGICLKHFYIHEKHKTERNCPAHVTFSCRDWERNPDLNNRAGLGRYAEILEVIDV